MKNHRQGGKFGGDHTTLIDLAEAIADVADRLPEVTIISAGFIKSGIGGTGGVRSVKFNDCRGGILLTVRQSGSVQEVRIITKNPHNTKLAIARNCRNNNVAIKFGGRQ